MVWTPEDIPEEVKNRRIADGLAEGKKRGAYRLIFVAHTGPGPYACYFCSYDVNLDELFVHHVNHDHFDDRLENLVATHGSCHMTYHTTIIMTGVKKTPEHCANISKGKTGFKHSEESKAQMSRTHKERGNQPTDEARELARQANTGRKNTEETKAKMSEAAQNRPEGYYDHLLKYNLGVKRSEETRKRQSEAAKKRCARQKLERELKQLEEENNE
jgi:hypothetical protein